MNECLASKFQETNFLRFPIYTNGLVKVECCLNLGAALGNKYLVLDIKHIIGSKLDINQILIYKCKLNKAN